MSSSDSPFGERPLRLRGEVEGSQFSFLVGPGEHTLGSSEESDLLLPVRGVSRLHARLRTTESGLEVEDLGSRNGTFVNGAPTRRCLVAAGETIRFGPATFSLEEIAPGDLELGVALPASSSALSSEGAVDEPTSRVGPKGMLEAAEILLAGLVDGGDERFGTCLDRLVKLIAADGACLLEGAVAREAIVLAARGRLEELSDLPEVWHAIADSVQSTAGGPKCQSGSSAGPPASTWATVVAPLREPLSLIVRHLGEAPEQTEALLRLLLLPMAALRSPASAGGSSRQRAQSRAETSPEMVFPSGYVVGETPAILELYRALQPLLRSDLPVLIEGETGVGKENIAQILHLSSRRCDGPFVAINCAAIPDDLLEAEMFGIRSGVATGVAERQGRFQQAQGGTLLLDEVSELPAELQAKLLRVLQEKEISPVGGKTLAMDARVLAATNADLESRVEEGLFRSDLYYRIAGSRVRVPPLRQRRGDIPQLMEHFLEAAAKEAGKSIRGITVRALECLVAYAWPGNVRELQHELERLAHRCANDHAIDSTMLSESLLNPPAEELESSLRAGGSLLIEDHVRRLITVALERAGGSQRKAAVLLGISRNTLARKIKRFGIDP